MVEMCEPFAGRGFRPPVSGVLIDVSQIEHRGRTRTQFTLRRKDRTHFAFLDQLDLAELIVPEHVGQFIVVKLDTLYSSPAYSVWLSGDKRWHDGQIRVA